jgi:hypothetical protein
LIELLKRNYWEHVALLCSEDTASLLLGELFVESAKSKGIVIDNELNYFSPTDIETDSDYIKPFLSEIMGLDNHIMLLFASPTHGKIVLEKFVEMGAKAGDYTLISTYWLDLSFLET